jgi:hypothetical protein
MCKNTQKHCHAKKILKKKINEGDIITAIKTHKEKNTNKSKLKSP